MTDHDREHADEQPETAFEEVRAEAEDAERRITESGRRRRDGEAGEAVTPDTDAREQSSGDG
ncbi:MAG TPA: hypothetical protein VFP69_11440 [Streptomyces sp.]|nr:hypothetical protein [Streptomyces sp.]